MVDGNGDFFGFVSFCKKELEHRRLLRITIIHHNQNRPISLPFFLINSMTDTTKTVPISGRISQEDHDFLMQRSFGGKVTASEKLRFVASFFRQYHEHFGTFPEGVEELNRISEPARKNLRRMEERQEVHSELVDLAANLFPQGVAYLASRRESPSEREELAYLLETEERLLGIILRLIEQVLRLGLTRQTPAYNPRLFENKLQRISELIGLLPEQEEDS